MADLGYAAKVRPVLILSIDYNDEERAVVTYVPRTTRVWSEGRFDVPHKTRGMKDGAFAVQLVGTAPDAKVHATYQRSEFLNDGRDRTGS
jgi:mRNA interferase MazF